MIRQLLVLPEGISAGVKKTIPGAELQIELKLFYWDSGSRGHDPKR